MKTVKDAAEFAVRSHGNQKYGGRPYSYHLMQVYTNAVKFGGNTVTQMAAWLHDTIEDTRVTKYELSERFGSDVANIVDLVSNQGSKESTFYRIRRDPRAVFVKLCDRLANVTSGELNNKYRKEHTLFRSILHRDGEFEPLWQEIEEKLKV